MRPWPPWREPRGPGNVSRQLLDLDQLYIKQQGGIRRNATARRTPVAVAPCRRDDELALTADLHSHRPRVRPFYDPASADRHVDRPVAITRAVELLTLVVRSGR